MRMKVERKIASRENQRKKRERKRIEMIHSGDWQRYHLGEFFLFASHNLKRAKG
jgi:hypothetical protein